MKKIATIIALSIFASVTGYSQNTQNRLTRDLSSFSPLKSPNQQIIEQVVNSGVFIVKQSYELADSLGNRYGLNGNKEFGVDYSLAVKIKNGFLISERTIHPWDFNPLFDQYRKDYTPKLFPSTFSEMSNAARFDSITIVEDSLKTLFSGLLYAQASEQFFGDGFSVGGKIGENDGWIVWFTKKHEVDFARTTELSLSIVKKKLSITPKKDNESYFYQLDSLSTNDEIVGGIFVIPEVVGVGHMELKLCGVACKIENGWMLCCPFVSSKDVFKHVVSQDNICMSESKSPILTPNRKEDVSNDKVFKSKKKIKK